MYKYIIYLYRLFFFTVKLYINGKWTEFVIDDYMPCLKQN